MSRWVALAVLAAMVSLVGREHFGPREWRALVTAFAILTWVL